MESEADTLDVVIAGAYFACYPKRNGLQIGADSLKLNVKKRQEGYL